MQELLSKMELLERFRLTHHNYEFLESEKNATLKAKEDILAAKVAIEERLQATEARLREKEGELEGVKREAQHERLWAGELEIARKKWEEEVIRLRDRYEIPDSFINAATKKAVVTSFFKRSTILQVVFPSGDTDCW